MGLFDFIDKTDLGVTVNGTLQATTLAKGAKWPESTATLAIKDRIAWVWL